MRAGKLDRTLVFKRLDCNRTISPAGTVSEAPLDWTAFAQVRAELVSDAVTEGRAGFGSTSNAELVFRIRYRTDLNLEDQVHYQGKALNLVGILELGRRRALELRCEAVT